jgi:hypothetical protein
MKLSFKQYFLLKEETIKSVKYDPNDFDSDAFNHLTPFEIDQLGTENFVSKENWPSLRKFLVKRSIASNPLTDPELTAYTPGETLNLLRNPIIKEYHSKVMNYKVPESYDTIIFVPCAKTKPWEGACKGIYKSYNKIKKEKGNVYFVTISEPLGIVPQDLWSSFPQYDNPGLFKDPVQRSGLMTKDWKRLFGTSSRLQTPFDESAYKECIKILGNVIKTFIFNNPDFKYLSFVEDFKGRAKGTHSEMLDAAGFIDSSIRFLKRENPREEPYSYINKFL